MTFLLSNGKPNRDLLTPVAITGRVTPHLPRSTSRKRTTKEDDAMRRPAAALILLLLLLVTATPGLPPRAR